MQVEHHLSTTTARGYQPAPAITGRSHCDQRPGVCRSSDTEYDQLRARATREVIDVHRSVYRAPSVHSGSCHGVIRIIAEVSRSLFRGINDAEFGFNRFHSEHYGSACADAQKGTFYGQCLVAAERETN